MFKFLLFAALVAFVSAKPGVVAPLAYSAPVVSTYGAVPAVSAYSAYPAVSAYSAYPGAYHGAYPGAVSAYSAYPAVASPVAYTAGYPYAGYAGVKYF